MKKILKREKGITLIALIITVLIMLILAGVAISALTADGGMFSKTQSAVEKYNNAVKLQDEKITTLTNEMNKYFNKYSNGEGSGDEETLKDTTAPSVATIDASNIKQTTFTLTATGVDEESGIQKYEFYINGTLENKVTTIAGTAIYNVTGKTAETVYTCKVRVYDNAGNYKDSSEISVTTKTVAVSVPIDTLVKVGDYVNYDAGTWTEEDMTKITSSAGSPTVNRSTSKPTTQGEFGGFTVGQSRNTNSTPFNTSYTPQMSGWRVWDIDNSTGIVTIISAGHPETYYHVKESSSASINILKNRDCSMYVNRYATSAHILTGQEAATWYNKQFGTNYIIVENGGDSSSTFYGKTFATAEPISVLENDSYYWLASEYGTGNLYYINPDIRRVGTNYYDALGVRLLVSLRSDVLLEKDTGDGSKENPWKIVEN